MAGHARSTHTEGMADGNRAAIDVEALLRNAEPIAAIEYLAGESFVEFPQVDVVDLKAEALEQLWHGKDRADPHLVGLAAGNRETAEGAERLEPALLGERRAHDDASRGAVRQLAGIAGGDEAALANRRERRKAFQRGVGTIAFIALERDRLHALRIGVLVHDLLARRQRRDLVGT